MLENLHVKAIVWLPGVRVYSELASPRSGHLGTNGWLQFALKLVLMPVNLHFACKPVRDTFQCKHQFINVKTLNIFSLLLLLCACTGIRDRTCYCGLQVA